MKSKVEKLELQPAKKKIRILVAVEVLIFVLVAGLNLAPFVWGALTSLKTERDVMAYPPKLFGSVISFEHYKEVFHGTFFTGMLNSIWYSIVCIIVGLFFGLLAAYAMKRFRFRGKKAFFIIILSCIPLSSGGAAMVVPNYTLLSSLGMTNQWYTLPLIYMAYHLPITIWILMGGLEAVPVEIDEAAKIDGAGRWYIIFRLVMPLSVPAMASAALFIFLGAWNEFVVSSVLVSSQALYPLQVSIYNYMGFYGIHWGPLTAAATAAVIPTLIVFAFLGKALVSGLTAGSVKD